MRSLAEQRGQVAGILLTAADLLIEPGQLREEDRSLKLGQTAVITIANIGEARVGLAAALIMEAATALDEPLLSRDNLDSLKVDNVAPAGWTPAPELGIGPASTEAEAALYLAGRHPRTHYDAMRSRAKR